MTYSVDQYKAVFGEILTMLSEPERAKRVLAMFKDDPAMDSFMEAYCILNG